MTLIAALGKMRLRVMLSLIGTGHILRTQLHSRVYAPFPKTAQLGQKLNERDHGPPVGTSPLAAVDVCPVLRRLTESTLSLSPQCQSVQGRLGSVREKRQPADDPLLRARRPFPPSGLCKCALENDWLVTSETNGGGGALSSSFSLNDPAEAGRSQSLHGPWSTCSHPQAPASEFIQCSLFWVRCSWSCVPD